MKRYFLLCCFAISTLKSLPFGGPLHKPSLEERMAFSEWQDSRYKYIIVSWTISGECYLKPVRFTDDNQSLLCRLMVLRGEWYSPRQCYSFNIKKDTWSEPFFEDECKKPEEVRISNDMHRLMNEYMFKVLPKEVREEKNNFLCLTVSHDYKTVVSKFSETKMIILQLLTDKTLIQNMHKQHDVNFCFAKVD